MFFVAYTTAPFVLFVHLHVPPFARQSHDILQRFVNTLPPKSQLHLATMSFLTRPRHTTAALQEFGHVKRRLGIVNYAKFAEAKGDTGKRGPRLVAREFNIQGSNRGVEGAWVWDAIKEKVSRQSSGKV